MSGPLTWSMPVTSSPADSRWATRARPTNPPAPVTSAFTGTPSSALLADLPGQAVGVEVEPGRRLPRVGGGGARAVPPEPIGHLVVGQHPVEGPGQRPGVARR